MTAWCLRWRINRAAGGRGGSGLKVARPLTGDELDEMHGRWARAAQAHRFAAKVAALKDKGPVASRSPLRKLTPFMDERGLVRVGGRLKHASLTCLAAPNHPAG